MKRLFIGLAAAALLLLGVGTPAEAATTADGAGRSPTNGKEIKIHAKTIPAFAAGQGFKEAVDKN